MSRFGCRCGAEIRDRQYPPTHTGYLVTDMECDDAIIYTDNGRPDPMASREVMECPKCHCLWVEVEPRSNRYVRYWPDRKGIQLAEQQGGYRG